MKLGPFELTLGQKASAAGYTLVQNPGRPAWSGRDYKSFATEAYSRNVVAFRSINVVADAVAGIDWDLFSGEDLIDTDAPFGELWGRPNPLQSGPEFIRSVVGFFLIAGNAYIERVDGTGAMPAELWCHRPDRMRVVPGGDGLPVGYEYKNNGKTYRFRDDEVRHIKTFNPLDDFYGLSAVEAAAYGVDQHNESMAWIQSLLQNAARPSGALVVPDALGDEQRRAIKAELETDWSGSHNAGRPMLLEGGVDWKAMGLSPSDMAILETKFSSARDVALAFGVPPQLLGIPGDNTYSNYQEARLALYEDTVMPLAGLIAREITDWLGDAFGGLDLRPNFDAVPAVAEKKNTLFDTAAKATFLTINEKREMVGYEPIEGGDEREAPPRPQVETDVKMVQARLAYGI